MTTTQMLATPLPGKPTFGQSWRAMAGTGWRMMFHDRLKLMGTLLGVVFAVVLVNQQLGTFLGLLDKNVMLVDNVEADIWILPPFTEQAIAGKPLKESALMLAKSAPGVAWAEPLVLGVTSVALPNGGSEQVSLLGSHGPRYAGGPWSVVAGKREVIARTGTVIFEDSQRQKLGGVNLGSVRELGGRRVQVGGFTWGLTPFAPPFAFADIKLARDILRIAPTEQSFVLVGLEPGADPQQVVETIQKRLPETLVVTKKQYHANVVHYLLTKTAIGISFGVSSFFGLVIGFVTVSLSMFSSVIDNIRQFGTLKAVGATTWDLAKLLFTQAVTYSVLGTILGLWAVTRIADVARSPNLAIVLPPELFAGTSVTMVVICILASLLSLIRLRNVEPAMVFR